MIPSPTFKRVQNTTLPEVIAEQIGVMISEGHLKPGDRLPTEPELMKQFGVGRSTLREALKSLAIAGIIESRQGAGTYISTTYTDFLSNRLNWTMMLSERELGHVTEVRYALEGQTAALAAGRATLEQIENLSQILSKLDENLKAPDMAAEYDLVFHLKIAEASNNPLLLNLISSVRELIRSYIIFSYSDPDRPDESEGQHQRILEAIRARQPQQARQAMFDHLDYSSEWILTLARERQLRD
jgi:GntR family transcriptional repressor for pyruvate dehydrogenase complex